MKARKEKDNFFLLRLYVTGESPNSLKAISNLKAIVKEYIPDTHKIEIVDTLDSKSTAFDDGIIVTPALVRRSPLPMRQIIGDLSDESGVIQALGSLKKKSKK